MIRVEIEKASSSQLSFVQDALYHVWVLINVKFFCKEIYHARIELCEMKYLLKVHTNLLVLIFTE